MKPNTNAREIHIAHLYNWEGLRMLPSVVRTAERLGHDVEINVTKDGMGKIHSLQVMATPPDKKES